MKMLPDLSQLTHEQLLEFTRQLAMQHQSLAQSNQELEKSKVHIVVEIVQYIPNAVLSRTIIKKT